MFHTRIKFPDFGYPGDRARARPLALPIKRLFRCIYFGPMVMVFIETCYELEILSSNMDFSVISMHSTDY